ncbi:putative integral membrane protein [Pusillimonas sp. T7-7]|uniref:P-type ATPase n=1 Tax=Pusillimonas sp. (strain T7-7) TaxID=1007105 RepID=UPI0002084C89|nr:membrane protein [Pusillimonas sp. T7-7]AEC19987.1 putative integral membrane protein [Pusillimonas sp. T7-7]
MRAFSIFSTPGGLSDGDREKRRHMLARMGLGWLAMMQVMMFAFPGYLRSESMVPDNLELLDQAIFLMNWISLILTVPVMLYCAWPVWRGAFSSLRHARVGMDVPVALGIVAAFIPSAVTTWTARGEVYFDSVTMFVAFLLTARYLELCARQSVGGGKVHQFIEQFRASVSIRANRVAFWFVLVQLVLAFLVGAVWYVYAPERAIGVMVALLVMSCPCAMAMAVPTAVAAAHASYSAAPDAAHLDPLQLIQATGQVARQNLYGSVAWHLLMTPLAAFGLVAPWLAAITMLLSSLAVAANSWRLYRKYTRPHGGWQAAAAQG